MNLLSKTRKTSLVWFICKRISLKKYVITYRLFFYSSFQYLYFMWFLISINIYTIKYRLLIKLILCSLFINRKKEIWLLCKNNLFWLWPEEKRNKLSKWTIKIIYIITTSKNNYLKIFKIFSNKLSNSTQNNV